jgi:hypothetical protein
MNCQTQVLSQPCSILKVSKDGREIRLLRSGVSFGRHTLSAEDVAYT